MDTVLKRGRLLRLNGTSDECERKDEAGAFYAIHKITTIHHLTILLCALW